MILRSYDRRIIGFQAIHDRWIIVPDSHHELRGGYFEYPTPIALEIARLESEKPFGNAGIESQNSRNRGIRDLEDPGVGRFQGQKLQEWDSRLKSSKNLGIRSPEAPQSQSLRLKRSVTCRIGGQKAPLIAAFEAQKLQESQSPRHKASQIA